MTYDEPSFGESRVITRLDAVMSELECTMMAGGVARPAVEAVMSDVRKFVKSVVATTFSPPEPKGKKTSVF